METVTQVLATTSEISLKGRNRRWFERTLTDNVRRALSDLPVVAIERPATRWRNSKYTSSRVSRTCHRTVSRSVANVLTSAFR
jgi:adenylyl- and sulfurtransferase ThiI